LLKIKEIWICCLAKGCLEKNNYDVVDIPGENVFPQNNDLSLLILRVYKMKDN
jgi:hypothetical protein